MKKFLFICLFFSWVAAYTQPGSLDNSFGVFGISTQPVLTHYTDIAVQPWDGKIVVISANPNTAIFRYTSSGILDNGFGVNGKVNIFYLPKDLAISATGKIVVAGGNGTIHQYNSDGSPDLGFGVGGIVAIDVLPIKISLNAVTIDAQNRVLIAGAAYFNGFLTSTFVIARVNADGSPDGTFNNGSNVYIDPFDNTYEREGEAISVRNDGKIIVLIDSRVPGDIGNVDFLISYNDNGSINTGFSSDGRLDFQNDFKSFVLDATGRIIMVANPFSNLVRINANGTFDNSFGNSGFANPPLYGNSLFVQADERIVVAGSAFNSTSTLSFALCRYNVNGTLDNSFGNGGLVVTDLNLRAEIFDVAIHNKKIYAGGTLYVPTSSPNPPTVLGNPFGVLAAYDGSAVRLSCPPNQQKDTDPDQCYATVNNINPIFIPSGISATVNYKIEFNNVVIEQGTGSVSGKHFSKGVTTVTYTLAEGAGQPCIFTMAVTDRQAPSVTCPANISVLAAPGQCSATIPIAQLGNANATDNCDGNRTASKSGVPANNIYPVGVTTIAYSARDEFGNTGNCTQTVTVRDEEPPVITGESASIVVLSPPNHTMRDVTINYNTPTDNCSVTWGIVVTSNEPVNGTGDGDTDPDWIVIDDHHVKLRAERAANGTGRTYTITITATDGAGNTAVKTVEVKVPYNIKNPRSGKAFTMGSTVSFEGDFWDKTGNLHTAKWLVDNSAVANGIVTESAGNQNGKITGSYKFNVPGVYKLQMNVTDQTGITSYANTNGDLDAIVVIYDPNGGYAFGGGWYPSPLGALKSNPSATGKASYGFAVNYRNAAKPKGETQFEFKVGSFEFNALNFDYLVVAGAKAQCRGTGKIIGGQSGLGFIMTVMDGALDGTGVDKIRMKIYNRTSNAIIYDNQPGAGDAANPTAAVGDNSSIFIQSTQANLLETKRPGDNLKDEININDKLEIIAYPNPTNKLFAVQVKTNNTKDKILMQVVDQQGRVLEKRNNVLAGSMIAVGTLYKPGVYYIRIMQGRERRELKLIKLSN